MSNKRRDNLVILVIGSLGGVFEDLGTSPLYTMESVLLKLRCNFSHARECSWTRISYLLGIAPVVSIKYAIFILREADEDDGGIFAMLTLLHKNTMFSEIFDHENPYYIRSFRQRNMQ